VIELKSPSRTYIVIYTLIEIFNKKTYRQIYIG